MSTLFGSAEAACACPFVDLFYFRQGLTGAEIGWVGTIEALIGGGMARLRMGNR